MNLRSSFSILYYLSLFLQYSLGYVSYNGYSLFRIQTNSIDWLMKIENDPTSIDHFYRTNQPLFDIWTNPNHQHNHADVLVAPVFMKTFRKLLKTNGIHNFTVIKYDLQKEIDREKREHKQRRKRSSGNSVDDFNLLNYHRYDSILKYMQNLAFEYPHLVQPFNITKTFEGRNLIGLKIGTHEVFKPAIFIDAGIHAREWIAPAAALYIINKLVGEYGTNPDITELLEMFDWYILPVANPDGYEYSMTVDRLWRKTRSRNVSVNKWCVGADANRNWGYRWGEAGANRNPCSSIYPGSSAFSEVEVAGIRDFITWQINDLKVYISLHSYGQLFLSPWGYTKDKPNNYDNQKTAARLAVEAIKNMTGAEYSFGTITELMYPASGTSVDYMQNKGVPYIYGIELRPKDVEDSYGFTIPPRFIQPTGEEMAAAMIAMLRHIRQKD